MKQQFERRGNMVYGEDKGPGTAPLLAECPSSEVAQSITDALNAASDMLADYKAMIRERAGFKGRALPTESLIVSRMNNALKQLKG